MHDVYLSLGSNLGDRDAHLRGAIALIDALPETTVTDESPVYETAPMGPQDQGAYLNAAVALRTAMTPLALLKSLQRIEGEMGRPTLSQRRRWGPRVIDLDVLLFGKRVIDEPGLTVPHPGLSERWFVLKPLCDLAPDLRHPSSDKPMRTLLAELEQAERFQPSEVRA